MLYTACWRCSIIIFWHDSKRSDTFGCSNGVGRKFKDLISRLPSLLNVIKVDEWVNLGRKTSADLWKTFKNWLK